MQETSVRKARGRGGGKGARQEGRGEGTWEENGRRWDHGEKTDVAAGLDAAHVDLHYGALAVGVVEGDGLIRSGGHQGALNAPPPGRVAVRHPELVGQ
jgi:hypothetical protein